MPWGCRLLGLTQGTVSRYSPRVEPTHREAGTEGWGVVLSEVAAMGPKAMRSALRGPAAGLLMAGAGLAALSHDLGPAAPVRSACEPDYPPYCIVRPDGRADGFSVELMRAALKALGREVVFATGPWAKIKSDLARGEIEALPLVGRTPEREKDFDFTVPYLTMHGAIVVREGEFGIRGVSDLKGKRVAVLQGDNAEEYLHRARLGAVVVPRPSFEEALQELARGEHDAVLVQKLVALQLMRGSGIANLRFAGPPLLDFSQDFCFAVRKGDDALLAQLNEGLAIAIADGTFRRLRTKWFSEIEAGERIKSRIVVGGDDRFPPYEYLDANGQPAGFNVELTRAIARRMDLAVEIRLGPWAQIRRGLENGSVDVIQGMFYSLERDKQFAFSPPGSVVRYAAAVRVGDPEPSNLADLAGKSILVMAGDLMHDRAVESGLADRVRAVVSQEEALRLLAQGEGDCALVAEVPALYWIEKHGWKNLRICSPPLLSAENCYAVPRGNENLLARFSEGLAALRGTGEYRKIQSRWLGPYEPIQQDIRLYVRYGAAAVLTLALLLAGALWWSRTLRRQVEQRTRELTAEIEERKRGEAALRESEEKHRSILEGMQESYYEVDLAGNLTFFNDAMCRLMGRSREELAGLNNRQYTDAENAKKLFLAFNAVYRTGESVRGIDWEVLRKDGTRRSIEASVSLRRDFTGRPVGFQGVIQDITDRKRVERILKARVRIAELSLTESLDALMQAALDEVCALTDSPIGFFHFVEADERRLSLQAWSTGTLAGMCTAEGRGRHYDVDEAGVWVDCMRARGPVIHNDYPALPHRKGLPEGHAPIVREMVFPILRNRKIVAVMGVGNRAQEYAEEDAADSLQLADLAWDIVERRLAEEDLRRADQERERARLSETTARLVQGLAHEVRNPLFAIDVNAAVLERKAGAVPGVAEHARYLKEHVGRLDVLMRDLLELGRRPAAEERIECRLRDVAENAILTVEGRVPGSAGRLRLEAASEPFTVPALPDRLQRALVLLLENALQNSPPGASVKVLVSRTDGEAHVKVVDAGTGIPEKIRESLFEPFVTTHTGRRGLGLSLARHYVAAMGGRLQAEDNDPPPGATFTVSLPTEASWAEEAPPKG